MKKKNKMKKSLLPKYGFINFLKAENGNKKENIHKKEKKKILSQQKAFTIT